MCHKRGRRIMSESVFRKRGFKAHKKENERREKEQEQRSNSLWRFFLKDGEEDIPVRFLTEEPVLFYEHNIKHPDGKFSTETCTGEDCVQCANGVKSTYRGAWLVVDGRKFKYKDKEGKEQEGKDQIRLYVRGSTDIAKLDRISRKFGLTSRPYFATKTGTGTSTSYEIDRGDAVGELSSKQLENLFAKLPEKFKKHADPDDMDTLYDIVEDCIFGDVIEPETSTKSRRDEDEDEDDDDINEGVRKTGSKLSKTPKKKVSGAKKVFKRAR